MPTCEQRSISILAQYLDEISFFGDSPDAHTQRVEEVLAELDKGMREIEEGQTIPAEEFFEELRRKRGLSAREKDEKQETLRRNILEMQAEYSRYCTWRERSRILISLGKLAPPFQMRTRNFQRE